MTDVQQVYADLYNKGYDYAGWAGGVATESTISGVSAVNFLTGTVMMGWGGPQCRNLSEVSLDSIRMEMAQRYIETLLNRSTDQGGQISADVTYDETRRFHQEVFTNHNLSLDNWTLNTPMELVRQTQGDRAVEDLWREIRETGGDGLDGTLASVKLYTIVWRLTFSADTHVRDQALNWIEQVPGFVNWEAIGRSVDTLLEWLKRDGCSQASTDSRKRLRKPSPPPSTPNTNPRVSTHPRSSWTSTVTASRSRPSPAPSPSTTTPTACAPAPPGLPPTMACWCSTSMATASSIPDANSSATTPCWPTARKQPMASPPCVLWMRMPMA
ncbi:MAG: hypothetical protein ACK4NM_04935 [Hydrogenophaga sp.]